MTESSNDDSGITRLDKPVLCLTRPPSKPTQRSNKPNSIKSSSKNAPRFKPHSSSPRNSSTQETKNNMPAKSSHKKLENTVLQSRQIVFEILSAVNNGGQLDRCLASHAELEMLEGRDRRFVQLLATTCLRRRGQLEKIIAPLVTRRPFGSQAHANIVLAMGAAQLLFLKTGPHAAVDSTVELMRQVGFERLCGLANAVMRRLTRDGESLLAATQDYDNLPSWLKISWQHYWGDKATNEIAAIAMQPPSLDISVAKDPEIWAKKLSGTLIDGKTIRRAFDGDPAQLDGFAEGAWWVQDAAAALPARLFGNLQEKTVIDLCAAPGGKSAQLIAAGAKVIAIDINPKRLDRLRRNLKRLKMTAQLTLLDGLNYVPDALVDAILLDAPCSATGTIRRRPDILGRQESEDLTNLQSTQWELATTALSWLKPGGTLIYATCSLQPEEGEAIITAILDAAEGRFKIAPITLSEAGFFSRSINETGCLRILPSAYRDIGGVDGFFIARLISVP